MRLLPLLSFLCIFAAVAQPEADATRVQALGAWEASIATWDKDAFGSDAPAELLLYIHGETLTREQGQELVITNADLEIHLQSGRKSIIHCFPPRDELQLESIACKREYPDYRQCRSSLKIVTTSGGPGYSVGARIPFP